MWKKKIPSKSYGTQMSRSIRPKLEGSNDHPIFSDQKKSK